ncbi:type II toxin-antitoxin system Phd/YefM family antitoxin [Floridanema aerugineum]|uniref:Antitoxin n=1 Tax=Floridaenema aerugineum BLCC-F46 TaxID=3153654 RepID=A0ABV4X2Q7_9CYAN
MRSYTLTEASNHQEEIFEQASLEPVLVTQRSQPSHVIMSFDTYQHLIERLTKLEDKALGKVAQAALSQSSMVGTETFVESLKKLAIS